MLGSAMVTDWRLAVNAQLAERTIGHSNGRCGARTLIVINVIDGECGQQHADALPRRGAGATARARKSAAPSPRKGAVAIGERSRGPVRPDRCESDDGIGALGDGLVTAVAVDVGGGVAGVDHVDPNVG